MTPRVSVCIPVYNGAAYVAEAVQSVLAQTFGDFELVVIDNCSTDGTAEVVRAIRDERLRLEVNPRNLGAEGNWNRALQVAKAPYVKLLCHDDVLRPRCLEAQVAVLDDPQHARVGLVSCGREIIDPGGRVLMRRGARHTGVMPGGEAIRAAVRAGTNIFGEPGAVLLRAQAVRETGAFTEVHPYLIDADYWCRVLLRWDAYFDPEVLAAFRVSPAQWSVAVAGSQGRDFAGFVDKLRAEGAPIGTADATFGKAKGYANGYARQLLYRVWFR